MNQSARVSVTLRNTLNEKNGEYLPGSETMNKIILNALILFSLSRPGLDPAPPFLSPADAAAAGLEGSIQGRLIDADTQAPLISGNVTLMDTETGAATDPDGCYSIKNIAVGSYSIKFSYIGYESKTVTDVIVRSGRITTVDAELKLSALETEAITVSAGYFTRTQDQPVSLVNFGYEEIRRAPGSAGDVSRILMSLPSVTVVNDQTNNLIVRGGSPMENTFYIDNIEIPNINHFPTQGYSGGPIGVINVDLIRDVDFFTGGFSAQYGGRLSSILQIELREGNRSEFDGQLDLNFAGFGGVAEGPLSGGRGSWLLSIRRSYLDLVVETLDVGSTVAPRYGDAQWKVTWDANPRHHLTWLGVLSDDHNSPDRDIAIENDMVHYGNQDIAEGTVGINWRAVWDRRGYSNTSLALTSSKIDEDFFETNTGIHTIRNRSDEKTLKFRNVNHFRLSPRLAAEFGLEAKHLMFDYDNRYGAMTDPLGAEAPVLILDREISASATGGFVNLQIDPLPGVSIVAGLRADHFDYNGGTRFSPRLSLTWRLSPLTSLYGSTGLFSQSLPLLLLSQNRDNSVLRDPRALHLVLGIEHLLTESTRFTAELYDKTYDFLPIDPDQPALFLIDAVYFSNGLFSNYGRLLDSGAARSTGIELMVQKKLARNFYGLASASFFRSRYRDGLGNWRDRLFDNRILFSLEGGYKPNNRWEFSMRWIYAGGAPYTPFDLEASRRNRRAVLDDSRINAARYPDYHSLNLRFDRRFHFTGSNLVFYLSVWNAYDRKNLAGYFWNDAEGIQDRIYQWRILPIFGLEYEF